MTDNPKTERSGASKDLVEMAKRSSSLRALAKTPEGRAAFAKSASGRRLIRAIDATGRAETRSTTTPEKREAPRRLSDADLLRPLDPDPIVVPEITNVRERSLYGSDSRWSYFGDLIRLREMHRNANLIIDAGRLPKGETEAIATPGQGSINDVYRRLAVHDAIHRNRTTAAGAGGDFVPKAWVGDLFATAARQQSRMPDLLTRAPLPDKGTKVLVPYIGTGVAGELPAEGSALTPTDITSDQVEAKVVTIVASVVASRQLADRAGGLFDVAIAQDMARELARQVDLQIISGTGSGTSLTGLLNTANITTTTYTDPSPTVAEFRTKAWASYRDVMAASGLEPDTMVMHPRRLAWSMQGTDSNSRQTLAVDFPARPVAVGSLPTTAGTGTNEDKALVFASEAVVLMLGTPTFDVFIDDALSATNEVRLVSRLYAALAVRRPEGVGVITGTGMATPTL